MKLPDIELVGLEEKSYTLSAILKEDKINLVLFYNTNCLGCTGRAIPLAYKLQNKFDSLALTVIHSNFKSTAFTSDEVLSVFTDQKSPFNIYRELNHELYDYFKCEGTPHWLIFKGKKELVHSFFGSLEGAQMKLEYAIEELKEEFS